MPDTSKQQQYMKAKNDGKLLDERKFISLNGEMLKAIKGGLGKSVNGSTDNLCGSCPYHRNG